MKVFSPGLDINRTFGNCGLSWSSVTQILGEYTTTLWLDSLLCLYAYDTEIKLLLFKHGHSFWDSRYSKKILSFLINTVLRDGLGWDPASGVPEKGVRCVFVFHSFIYSSCLSHNLFAFLKRTTDCWRQKKP